jgi:hypothetical protein
MIPKEAWAHQIYFKELVPFKKERLDEVHCKKTMKNNKYKVNMSICQVENFYDAIRRYKAKDAVLKRTKQEVEYLKRQCGSVGSLKRYFSKYRNFLKDKVDKGRLVSGVPLLDLLLETLRLNETQQASFTKEQRREISQAQGTLRKIYDVDKYISIAVGLLDAVSVYDRILGLAALTGRRVAEIACSAKLKGIEGDNFKAIFTGQLKTKGRTDVTPYEIPLLHNYVAIAKTLKGIQKTKPQFVGKPALFNATASGRLSEQVKKHFSGLFEGEPKTKDLRAIYALLAFDRFQAQEGSEFVTISINKYFASILGHSVDDVVTCGSYIDFCTPTVKRSK